MSLVDSDVLIEVLRASTAAVEWLKEYKGDLALPAAVAWELLIGSRNARELGKTEKFLSRFRVEEIDAQDSTLTRSLIVAHSRSSGLSVPDYLVAAQAINRSSTLFTFNLRHFRVIPGLDVQAPYER